MSTYYELLKRPEWKAKRAEVIEAAGRKCQECGACATDCPGCDNCLYSDTPLAPHFEVHHKYYGRGRKPWEYPNDALMVLCRECHGQYTAAMDILKVAAGLLPKPDVERLISLAKERLFAHISLLRADDMPIPIPLDDLPTELRDTIGFLFFCEK